MRSDFKEHSQHEMASPFDALAKIVSKMIARKDADIFREPVPWEEYGLTDYLQIVKVPMDLGTVQEKLRRKMYGTPNDCGEDMHKPIIVLKSFSVGLLREIICIDLYDSVKPPT